MAGRWPEAARVGDVVHRHDLQAKATDPLERRLAMIGGLGDRGRQRHRHRPRRRPHAPPRCRSAPGESARTRPRRAGCDAKHLHAAPEPGQEGGEPDRAQTVDAGKDRPGVPFGLARVGGSPATSIARAWSGRTERADAEHRQTARAVIARDSDDRNQAASSRWSFVTRSEPARSAIVRATRRRRSTPRPLARSSSARAWT